MKNNSCILIQGRKIMMIVMVIEYNAMLLVIDLIYGQVL